MRKGSIDTTARNLHVYFVLMASGEEGMKTKTFFQ